MSLDFSPLADFVSTNNSSSATLTAGSTFTGIADYLVGYSTIGVLVIADVASATDGLILEFSSNGTNWDDNDKYTVAANAPKFFSAPVECAYFRVRYINGASNQIAFRLSVIVHVNAFKYSSHRVKDAIVDEDDAELVKAVIAGKRDDGVYGTAALDNSNRLQVIATLSTPTSATNGLAVGDVALSSVTTSAIRRTAYTEQSANFTGTLVFASASDTAAGTGVHEVTIYYIDSTGATAGTEVVASNGGTVTLTVTTKCFIEKMIATKVGSGGIAAGLISLKNGATTVGTIAAGDKQTFWSHHYVVTGKTCNITDAFHGNNSTVSGGTSFAFINAQTIGIANATDLQVSDFIGVAGAANPFSRPYGSTIKIAGPARLVMYVATSSSSSITYRGSFDFYE